MRDFKQFITQSVLGLAMIFVAVPHPAYATQPANLGTLKAAVVEYHDSGDYAKDLNKKITNAQKYLQRRVEANNASPQPSKLAIVLDIDETSLSNYDAMRAHDFGATHGALDRMLSDTNANPIKATRQLYQYAVQNNVKVFFVTGRKDKFRDATVKNLQAAGYQQWTKLIMEPNNYHNSSVVPFKSSARKQIAEAGYDIVINMGDQQSDLDGGYADKTFRLPNPYYYIA